MTHDNDHHNNDSFSPSKSVMQDLVEDVLDNEMWKSDELRFLFKNNAFFNVFIYFDHFL